jgi:hypothetical protein
MRTTLGLGKPLGYEQITSPAAATGLTVPSGARVAVMDCETQNCRWRDDGVDPTTAAGILMLTTDPPLIYDGNLSAVKIIQVTTNAKVNVSYYK